MPKDLAMTDRDREQIDIFKTFLRVAGPPPFKLETLPRLIEAAPCVWWQGWLGLVTPQGRNLLKELRHDD